MRTVSTTPRTMCMTSVRAVVGPMSPRAVIGNGYHKGPTAP